MLGRKTDRQGKPGSLLSRAQQWLSARERLLAGWIGRAHGRARAAVQGRITAQRQQRIGGAGAVALPYWWEYESQLKRQIALEAMLRRLFSMVPETPSA
jgi:hypothetical protein